MKASPTALWWMLTVVLMLGALTVLAFGVRQLNTEPPTRAQPAPTMTAAAPAPLVADSARLRNDVLEVGRTSAVRLLGYTPQNAERDLTAAAEELTTGAFRDSFTRLITQVVIPGATTKQITADVQVPAIAVETLDASSATLIVFVDQSVTIGAGAPTETASSMRMKLEKIGDAWLVAAFDPL